MTNIPVLQLIVSAVVYFGIGAIWYTPLFGKAWAKQAGIDYDAKAPNFALSMAGQFVSSVIFAVSVYAIIAVTGLQGIAGAAVAAAIVSAVTVSVSSGKLFFQNKPLLFAIDAGYSVAGSVAVSLILALWK